VPLSLSLPPHASSLSPADPLSRIADAKAEAAKMDLLEDDDEFEIDQGTRTPPLPCFRLRGHVD